MKRIKSSLGVVAVAVVWAVPGVAQSPALGPEATPSPVYAARQAPRAAAVPGVARDATGRLPPQGPAPWRVEELSDDPSDGSVDDTMILAALMPPIEGTFPTGFAAAGASDHTVRRAEQELQRAARSRPIGRSGALAFLSILTLTSIWVLRADDR